MTLPCPLCGSKPITYAISTCVACGNKDCLIALHVFSAKAWEALCGLRVSPITEKDMDMYLKMPKTPKEMADPEDEDIYGAQNRRIEDGEDDFLK